MRKNFLIICLALSGLAATINVNAAQPNEPNYELAARFSPERLKKMVFSRNLTPMWFQNSNNFIYTWTTPKGMEIYMVDPVKGTKTKVVDMTKLAMQITEITKDPFDAQHLKLNDLNLEEDRYLTFYVDGSQDREFDEADSSYIAKINQGSKQDFYFKYDIQTRELTDVTLEEQDKQLPYPEWAVVAPDGTKGIYAKDNNLYMMDSTNLRKAAAGDTTLVEIKLTSDGSRDFSWGADSYKGNNIKDTTVRTRPAELVWSPDSKKFATFRYDMSRVKDLWVINSLSNPRPTLETYKYQMPGEPGPEAHLALFDVNEDKADWRYVNIAKWPEQMTMFCYAQPKKKDSHLDQAPFVEQWLGGKDGFWMLRQARDMKTTELCYVPAGSAAMVSDSVRVVVTESMNTYVEDRPIVLVNDGKQFIQWSERNGWANLYLYNVDGTLVRNLTEGAYHVENVLGVNEAKGYVVFSATGVIEGENPYQTHTFKVSLKGGPIQQLDMDDMDVHSWVTEDGKFFVANYSRVDSAPASALYNAETGKKVMDLEEADLSLLFEAGYKFPERFKVKAADGITDLWGVMYKPFDFDPEKSYPIIDYVYPGPQIEANNISWSIGMNRVDRLAQIGFIVITVGNRGGHPQRSKWYHNFGYGNLRDYGLEDQKYAIQQLAARHNFVDIDRVGIHGHSGGGFMSTAAILTYQDFFKVAVSCAGNHDNKIYNRWWSETHNGYQEVEPETSYNVGTNPELAANLKGHLMLVHGDIDDNVHPANSLRVVNALIKANKRFDLLILPGQRHGFKTMDEYFFWRMADYFSEWLLGSSNRSQVNISHMNND